MSLMTRGFAAYLISRKRADGAARVTSCPDTKHSGSAWLKPCPDTKHPGSAQLKPCPIQSFGA
jgi:hypothetical protein